MTHLYRRESGQPIRDAMRTAGLSIPRLAEATRQVDPESKGVSAASVAQITGSGVTAHDRCRIRTAWLIAEALGAPLQGLFSMTAASTVTDERATPMAMSLAERTEVLRPVGLTPLLTQKQLQAHFGVSHWSVEKWLELGMPIRRTPSGGRRFDLAKVESWMDEQAANAA